jgi:hypothetical protein
MVLVLFKIFLAKEAKKDHDVLYALHLGGNYDLLHSTTT